MKLNNVEIYSNILEYMEKNKLSLYSDDSVIIGMSSKGWQIIVRD